MNILAILLVAYCVVVSQAKAVPTNNESKEEARLDIGFDLEKLFTELIANHKYPVPDFAKHTVPSINATDLATNVRTLYNEVKSAETLQELRQIDWATTLYPLFNILINLIAGPVLVQVVSLIPAAALPTLFGGSLTVDESVGYIIYSVYNPFIYVLNTYLFG